MPSDRAPTPLSHTTISVEDSEDRSSERSDSVATVEVFRTEPDTPGTPSENTDGENDCRHRVTNTDDVKNFIPTEIPEIPLERKKSNGLSKGVILSAMNFGGSYDLKCDPKENKEKVASKDHEMCENGSVSPKALETSAENNAKASEEEKSEEKKKMSLPRKIAFGFSFLPSVMFVLTFAVILPCEEYKLPGGCVRNKWSLVLNQTDIASYLSLPKILLLGYQFENTSDSLDGLMNLNIETGDEMWKLPLDSYPKHVECRNVDVNQDGITDCLTILNNGDVRAFNLSNGNIFWTFSINQPNDATVLLTGCLYKDYRPVAIASYSKGNVLVVDVLSETDGSLLISKEVRLVSKCLNSDFSLQTWSHDNETDLLYNCVDSHGFAHIWSVKQSDWCPQEEGNSMIIPQDMIKFDGNVTDSVYLPTSQGLLLWTSTEVTFIHPDSKVKWQYSTDYFPRGDRIVKFGNFYIGGEQVALIAKNASYYTDGVVVSVLSSDDGKELIQVSLPYKTVNQVVVLKGNETDALLISAIKLEHLAVNRNLQHKRLRRVEFEPHVVVRVAGGSCRRLGVLAENLNVKETDQKPDKEVFLKSNVTSENFRKDVAYNVAQRKDVEDLVLFQFEGKNTTHVVLQTDVPPSCWKDFDFGSPCKSENQAIRIISASSEKEDNLINLKIITLRATGDNLKQNESQSSQIRALDIRHQDNPSDGESSCTL